MCLLAVTAAQQPQRSYRILISNDDGVRAPALPVLAQALRPIGEVIIVAPVEDRDRSSAGGGDIHGDSCCRARSRAGGAAAVNNGYVSVTPMHVGEYDEKLAVTLRGWFTAKEPSGATP